MADHPVCRICGGASRPFNQDRRSFFRCIACSLVFTEPTLPPDEEARHYVAQWQNQPAGFWTEPAEGILTIARRYREPSRILDFGSGSGGLTEELRTRGYSCTPLEPMVHGRLEDYPLDEPFDLVVGIEVIEHLVDPWRELREIDRRLVPGGVMIFTTLLTESFINAEDAVDQFREWWYKDDLTHVSFFCHRTLQVIGLIGHYDVDVMGGGLFVIRKRGDENAPARA